MSEKGSVTNQSDKLIQIQIQIQILAYPNISYFQIDPLEQAVSLIDHVYPCLDPWDHVRTW